jgi:hypothetical protein
MKQDWDVDNIIQQLRRCNAAVTDSYLTGFVQWPCKQDLYLVKFILDEMLRTAPTFSGEEEWLREQQKKQVWNVLNQRKGI